MMKIIKISIATLGLVVWGLSSAHGQTPSLSPNPIAKVLNAYDDAWYKKDVAAVSKILTHDYAYFSSTGGVTRREETLKFLVSPDYKLTFVERGEVELVSRTDAVIILSSRWKGRGTYGKEEINDDQRCGLVFVKAGNSWKLLSEHCVQIVSK